MQWIRNKLQILQARFQRSIPFIAVFGLILVLLFAYLFNSIVYTIHSGEGGVLYRRFFGGTVIDKVYPEGIHFVFPWDKMYIYNVRIQQVSHDFDVLTREGLRIHLDVSIRYYPEYELLGMLHKVVGPDYAKTVVIPKIEMVLRVLVGKMDAEEFYTTEGSITEKSINEAIEQIHQRFISVDDVVVKNITLPQELEKAIEYKIAQKHMAEAQIFLIERQKGQKQCKIIEGEGMRQYNDIVRPSLTEEILRWMGIQATLELAKSPNAKVVVAGAGSRGFPVFGNVVLDAPDLSQSTLTNIPTPLAPTDQDSQEKPTAGSPSPSTASSPEAVKKAAPAPPTPKSNK